MRSSTIRKSETKHASLASLALSTSRILQLFGWDNEVAEEFCRPILRSCDPERAFRAFQEIYDETRQMPSQSEVIVRAKEPSHSERWITFERDVLGHGRISYARKIPSGEPVDNYLRPGETLKTDTEDRGSGRMVRWFQCQEGIDMMVELRKFCRQKPFDHQNLENLRQAVKEGAPTPRLMSLAERMTGSKTMRQNAPPSRQDAPGSIGRGEKD